MTPTIIYGVQDLLLTKKKSSSIQMNTLLKFRLNFCIFKLHFNSRQMFSCFTYHIVHAMPTDLYFLHLSFHRTQHLTMFFLPAHLPSIRHLHAVQRAATRRARITNVARLFKEKQIRRYKVSSMHLTNISAPKEREHNYVTDRTKNRVLNSLQSKMHDLTATPYYLPNLA